jgi:acyl dehydratase
MSQIRNKSIDGLDVGDTFTISRSFSEQAMQAFADITRDYNPIHFDERFAKGKKLHARICHGLLVGSMLTEIGGQIGWLATGMNFRFKHPVFFGDTIECKFTITKIDEKSRAEANAIFQNQDGLSVIEAELTGKLPAKAEREVMRTMVQEGDPTNKC